MNEIIIRLGMGTIQTGFNNVNIELKSAGITQWEDRSSLRANPELEQLLNQWQLLYPAVLNISNGINLSGVFDDNGVSHVSIEGLLELNDRFRTSLNDWLNGGSLGKIVGKLRTELNIGDRILVIIICEQLNIWQLPWHFWNLLEDYPHAVEAFCKPRFGNVAQIQSPSTGKVNILSLFGRDPKLNLNPKFLKTLVRADVKSIEATSAYQVAAALNLPKPWKIFIFNGHGDTVEYSSSSDFNLREGFIYLDNNTRLEISALKREVRSAVDRGLQIAIFNCCRGLGLLEQLSDLNIPYIIVMRELIPSDVAQQFLTDLLTQYSQGDSFPEAFKYARQRLALSGGEFARFADWLPILFHNPLSNSVTWQDLSTPTRQTSIPAPIVAACSYLSHPKYQIWTTVGISLLVSLLILQLQSMPSIAALENRLIDRTHTNLLRVFPQPSKVTIVNYDFLSVAGIVGDDRKLLEIVKTVEQVTKPIAWGLDLRIDNNRTILDLPNISEGCLERSPPEDPSTYALNESQCDRPSLVISLLERSKLYPSPKQTFRLNFQRLEQIDRIDATKIASLPSAEIDRLFKGKMILVGLFERTNTNPVARKAIAIDQIVRANRHQYPIPILVDRSIGVQFLWLFIWSILIGIAAWNQRWQLLLAAIAIAQIVIAGLLLTIGQGMPMVVLPIELIPIAITILTIKYAGRLG
jgi:hypothetical protein